MHLLGFYQYRVTMHGTMNIKYPSSTHVKNTWNYTQIPPCIFMVWYFIKYQDNCTSTNSIEQSHSWEASRFLASQEISHIVWNLKIHDQIHKSPLPVSCHLLCYFHPQDAGWSVILYIWLKKYPALSLFHVLFWSLSVMFWGQVRSLIQTSQNTTCYFSKYVRKTQMFFQSKENRTFIISRAHFLISIKIMFQNKMELVVSAIRTTIKGLIAMSITCALQ